MFVNLGPVLDHYDTTYRDSDGWQSLLDRLALRSDIEGDCIVWTGARCNNGYGNIGHGGKTLRTHRVAYEVLVGPIPPGLVIDHLCRNPPCINPDHLEPVPQGENMRRGTIHDHQRAKTHCPRGHEYSPENTAFVSGGRICRECRREAGRRSKAKARAARRAEP